MSDDDARPEIGDAVQYPTLQDKVEDGPATAPETERQWLVFWPEDVSNLMIDEPGNVALLVDEEQAREVKRLAERAIDALEDGGGDE